MEIKCLRSKCGVTVGDRIRNEEIRRRVGVIVHLSGRAERYAFKTLNNRAGKNDCA